MEIEKASLDNLLKALDQIAALEMLKYELEGINFPITISDDWKDGKQNVFIIHRPGIWALYDAIRGMNIVQKLNGH